MDFLLLAEYVRLRVRYAFFGAASAALVDAYLRVKREGWRDELVRMQIEATKRAHTARRDAEALERELFQ